MNLEEPDPPVHEYCSVDCPCGHWSSARRRPTKRADGRRGRPNLDVIDEDPQGDANASR